MPIPFRSRILMRRDHHFDRNIVEVRNARIRSGRETFSKLARDEARKAGIVRLDKIIVRIGNLSGVSEDGLDFAFGFLRERRRTTCHTQKSPEL